MRGAVLAVLIVCACWRSALAQLFEIAQPTFSAFVTNDGTYTVIGPAVDGTISRTSLTHGALYFSFTVIGGDGTIDHLQKNNSLDVAVAILGDQTTIVRGLGISPQKWAAGRDAWMAQHKQQGYFTFRTFMDTQQIAGGAISLQVRDEKNAVIRPVAYELLTYKASVTIVP